MRWGVVCALATSLISSPMCGRAAESAQVTSSTLAPCGELPVGRLSDADLKQLVPDNSPGRVRVVWQTESQEDTYGFNILKSDTADGHYKPVNTRVIPGEGTTNVRKVYCFEDVGLERGRVYFYQIEEVTNAGQRSIVKGTEKARVQVKTVDEERTWLKKKALEAEKSAAEPTSPVR